MKKHLLIVLIVVAAVAFIALQIGLSWYARRVHKRQQDHPWNAQAVKIEQDQMMYFHHAVGQGLVDFTDYSAHEAGYRFRFRNADTGTETSGVGRVFERYSDFGLFRIMRNSKSQSWIKAGGVSIAWSYCGPDSLWVYYHTNRTHIEVFPDSLFETMDLVGSTETEGLSNDPVEDIRH